MEPPSPPTDDGVPDGGPALALLFGMTTNPAWIVERPTLRILEANPAAAQHWGYSMAAFRSLSLAQLHAPATPGEPISAEAGSRVWRLRRSDGGVAEAPVRCQPLLFQGRRAALAVMERCGAEARLEALSESEQRFRDVAEAAGEFIMEVDLDGRYTYLSDRIEDVLGYPRSELLGRSPAEFMPPSEAERVRDWLAENMGPDFRFRDLEHRMVTRSGRLLWIRVSTVPIFDREGRRIGHRGTGRDVTERKHAESRIRELNASLERRVSARTAELEHANRELESFSYSVSHDLRAPLRAINGYCHILLETEHARLSADGEKILRRVVHNTSRMGELIDDILAWSRSGRQPLTPGRVDLDRLVHGLVGELREAHPAARIEIGALPAVEGDAGMLKQVWTNLLDNALKFSAKRADPHVSIGAEPADAGWRFWVSDNGAGFDMRYAGKLFGVFQRLHLEREFPGTGVGLAIVKRLVERHGGRVWAESAPGEGARFFFTLGAAAERAA